MRRFRTLASTAVALLSLTVALPAGDVVAQTAKDLVGTWAWVSVDATQPDGKKVQLFGPSPKGAVIFDGNGRFAYVLMTPGRAKFAANNREQGTADENKATVQGSLAYYGTYSVADKTLTFKIEASSYPNAESTEQKRTFTLAGDDLKWTNPLTTTGATAETALKRVK